VGNDGGIVEPDSVVDRQGLLFHHEQNFSDACRMTGACSA
jgi:hypothetical protein